MAQFGKPEVREGFSPQVYHHKWLWVSDSYRGFDVEESKERSIEIKWSGIRPSGYPERFNNQAVQAGIRPIYKE